MDDKSQSCSYPPLRSSRRTSSRFKNVLAQTSMNDRIVTGGALIVIIALLLSIFTAKDDPIIDHGPVTSLVTLTVTKTQSLAPINISAPTSTVFVNSPDSNLNDVEQPVQDEPEAESDHSYDQVDERPEEDWNLESFEISWGELENYKLEDKLGQGSFSEVFQAVDVRNNKTCVAKVLKPTKKRRVKREIKILQHIAGGPNVVHLVEVVRNAEKKSPAIVFEYINNTHYDDLYPELDDMDIRFYMFQLLSALEHAHSKNIMHRDLKPSNVMIDHENRKLRLIDWGLSEYYDEDESYPSGVGSRYWRAPEMLIGYEWYNPSVDIWSFGAMLAALVYEKEPFFRGRHNDANQLIEIAKILGTEHLFEWLNRYEIELDEEFDDVHGWYKRQSWESLVSWQNNRRRVGEDVIDLLKQLLVYDHNERLTATEALAHPYFDPVREEALDDPNVRTQWVANF